jgi:hypothetical protein
MAPDSRQSCGSTRTPSALKCEALDGNIFTGTPEAVQFKVFGLLSRAVTQNLFEEDCFAGVT